MKLLLVAAFAALALSACASLDSAGHSGYSVTTARDAAGNVTGHDLAIKDGKEYASRQINFEATKDGAVSLVVTEGASLAFPGQAIAAKAATVLPVSGLQDILKP